MLNYLPMFIASIALGFLVAGLIALWNHLRKTKLPKDGIMIDAAEDRRVHIVRDKGVLWAIPCDDPCEGWELNAPDMSRTLRRRAVQELVKMGVSESDMRLVRREMEI